jgi:hypothetical protein
LFGTPCYYGRKERAEQKTEVVGDCTLSDGRLTLVLFLRKCIFFIFVGLMFLIKRIKRDTSVPFYANVNIRILITVEDVTILYLIHPSYGITDRSGAFLSEYCASTAVKT